MTKNVKTHCSSCDSDTNHKVLFKKSITNTKKILANHDYDFSLPRDYLIVQCAGCNRISFVLREYYKKREFFDLNYPNENRFAFLDDEDFDLLPSKLRDFYEEIEQAFLSESEVTAASCLRIMIEAICKERQILGKNLYEKISNLQSKGFISSSELPILDNLRLIGNKSVHEMRPLPLDKLEYALDIVNHILKGIYVLPKINKKLKLTK